MEERKNTLTCARMVKRLALSSLIGLGAAAPAAFAQGTPFMQGGYVGFGAGQSKMKDTGSVLPGGGIDDSDTGWKIFGGYKFNPNLSAELTYIDFGQFEGGGGVTGSWEPTGINGSVLGILPLPNQFSVFGKLGATRWDVDNNLGGTSSSDNSTDVSYGIGAQYDFNRDIGARLEWERFADVGETGTTGQSDLDLLSASVVWNF